MSFWGYVKHYVTAVLHTITCDVMNSVFEKLLIAEAVIMCRRAELQIRKLRNVMLKHFGHIVIEYIGKGVRMHADNRLLVFVLPILEFLFDKIEVGDWL